MTDSISGYISLGPEKLHYLQWGNGVKLLLAFHGYGNDATVFSQLANELDGYTIVSIDLPYHGNSTWTSDDRPLSEEDMLTVVNSLKEKHGVNKVCLAGYSMGGRVCLKITELMPNVIDKVVLIASDGLHFNSFYYFLTRTLTGKGLFKSFLNNPKPYSYLIDFARKLNIVNNVRYNLAMRYVRAESDRQFLLKVWPCMAYILPDMNKLKNVIAVTNIPLGLFMGKYDTIIPLELGYSFKKQIPSTDLVILDKGHKVLDADTVSVIVKYIQAA